MSVIASQAKTNGFPNVIRLRKASEFKAVFNQSRRFTARNFALYCCRNNLTHPRLGISIAKRNVRNASERNRIKRIVRETFRLQQTSLPDLDVVIVAYRGSDSLTNVELQHILNELWQTLDTHYKKA